MNKLYMPFYWSKCMAVLLCTVLLSCYSLGGRARNAEDFSLKQGVNIGDWLSQKANISFKEKCWPA